MPRMITSRVTVWLFLIVFCTGTATLLGSLQSRSQVPDQEEQRANSQKEKDAYPIVDYAQTPAIEPVDLAKRRIRGAKHDKSVWHVNPNDDSDRTVLVDVVDQNLPAFPVTKSTVVVLGEVTGGKAYLSNDKTGVYTEFPVRIEEIYKDDSTLLTTGKTLEISRQGGRVRFPSGREHLYKVAEENMPHVGGRYVFFLTGNHDQGFSILTAYEVQAGKMIPLDNLPRTQAHKDADQTAFLNQLRIEIVTPRSLQ